MKKLMIVQPISGRLYQTVEAERAAAAQNAADVLGEALELLDRCGTPCEYFERELEYLAENLERMAQADVVYFVHGWENAHLCRVLHDVAASYDLLRLYG